MSDFMSTRNHSGAGRSGTDVDRVTWGNGRFVAAVDNGTIFASP